MINNFFKKISTPMKHPVIYLILFYIIGFALTLLLLIFNIIGLRIAKMSIILILSVFPLSFYFLKFCIRSFYEDKMGGLIAAMIISLIAIGVFVSFLVFAIPVSTNIYTKNIILKSGNAENSVLVLTEEHNGGLYGSDYVYNYIHCKSSNNKTYKIRLESRTKINWKKGKINKAELTMNDEYSVFGNKIDSKATNVTVYYTSK